MTRTPVVTPTVLADNPQSYKEQIDRISQFASRIHIDLADDIFTSKATINPIQAWWPTDKHIDVHFMVQNPQEHLQTLISKNPNLVIFHAEANLDFTRITKELKSFGISSGLAILADSPVNQYQDQIKESDHVLIFSGSLGRFGGSADLSNLAKVAKIKEINPDIEIGWDGGINDENVGEIAAAGVSVLNVGGFIQKADKPQVAYDILSSRITDKT